METKMKRISQEELEKLIHKSKEEEIDDDECLKYFDPPYRELEETGEKKETI